MRGVHLETDPGQRVVITGFGAFLPNGGPDLKQITQNMAAGKSGINKLDPGKYPFVNDIEVKIGGDIPDSNYKPEDYATKEISRNSRAVILTYAAMLHAVVDAGFFKFISDIPTYNEKERAKILGDRDNHWLGTGYLSRRVGAYIGTAVGGSLTMLYDRLGAFTISKLNIGQMVSTSAINLDMRGPTLPIVAACAAGALSFGMAADQIRNGYADVMLAGGGEDPFYKISFDGFHLVKALSTRNDSPEKASRPLDKDQDGFVMSKGAVIGVLESLANAQARGARIYGEVLGYGHTTDASHAFHPYVGGIEEAMRIALERSGVRPEQINRLLMHVTSTGYDPIEAGAVHNIFGGSQSITLGTPKSTVGHMQGAAVAGAVLQGCLELQSGKAFPSINLENRIPEIGNMTIPTTATPQDIEFFMVNGLGLGGTNGSVIIRRIVA